MAPLSSLLLSLTSLPSLTLCFYHLLLSSFFFRVLCVPLSSGLPSSLHDELMANKQTLAPVLGRRRGHRAAGQNSEVAI